MPLNGGDSLSGGHRTTNGQHKKLADACTTDYLYVVVMTLIPQSLIPLFPFWGFYVMLLLNPVT